MGSDELYTPVMGDLLVVPNVHIVKGISVRRGWKVCRQGRRLLDWKRIALASVLHRAINRAFELLRPKRRIFVYGIDGKLNRVGYEKPDGRRAWPIEVTKPKR